MFRGLVSAILLQSALLPAGAFCGGSQLPDSPRLSTGVISTLPPSNSVSHFAGTGDNVLWIGSSKGVARTPDGGRSWEQFGSLPQFARPGIFSIVVQGDTIWTSTGYSQRVDQDFVQTGTGYTFSTDNGATWTQLPQTVDAPGDSIVQYGSNTVRFLPVIVDEQNVTYDIALSTTHVWIASWASGIRRSSDRGTTWERIVLPNDGLSAIAPTDSLGRYNIDPRLNNNFLGFSVYAQDDTTIWAGTAGGINKSTDGGASWVKFNSTNQASPILANWVIAIEGQQRDSVTRVWCTNWITTTGEEYGVSYTDDGGRIWHNTLHGIKAYDFAFSGTTVYIATDDGIYRSVDDGATWQRSGTIVDRTSGQVITTMSVFAVATIGDTLFGGTGDGMVMTIDDGSRPFGSSWNILRTYVPATGAASTYAFPNPFSPASEISRIHYTTGSAGGQVTIEVFDFGMNRVRTVVKDAGRTGGIDHDEIWDGRNDQQETVTNGVYFYRLTINDGDPVWGKVMVLQ